MEILNRDNYKKTIIVPNRRPVKLIEHLKDFIFKKQTSFHYDTQEDLAKKLTDHFDLDKIPNQGTVSRALEEIRNRTFEFDDGKLYVLGKTKDEHKFILKDTEMEELYNLKDIFQQESVYEIGKKVLVFHVSKDRAKVNLFLQKIDEHFPKEIFWSISRHEEHIFLMFDKNNKYYNHFYDRFLNFFENRAKYFNQRKIERKPNP